MARVLKPGGILALATEYCLSGPPHHEAFQPAQVLALLDDPSLELVQPIDLAVWDRYAYVRSICASIPPDPHMVVTDLGRCSPPSWHSSGVGERARDMDRSSSSTTASGRCGNGTSSTTGSCTGPSDLRVLIAPGPLTFDLFERASTGAWPPGSRRC